MDHKSVLREMSLSIESIPTKSSINKNMIRDICLSLYLLILLISLPLSHYSLDWIPCSWDFRSLSSNITHGFFDRIQEVMEAAHRKCFPFTLYSHA